MGLHMSVGAWCCPSYPVTLRVFDASAIVWCPNREDTAVVLLKSYPFKDIQTTNWRAAAVLRRGFPGQTCVVIPHVIARPAIVDGASGAVFVRMQSFTEGQIQHLQLARGVVDVLPLPDAPVSTLTLAPSGGSEIPWGSTRMLYTCGSQEGAIKFLWQALPVIMPWAAPEAILLTSDGGAMARMV